MKCVSCGAVNADRAIICQGCGSKLPASREDSRAGGDSARKAGPLERREFPLKRYAPQSTVDHKMIPDKIKLEYSRGVKDSTQRSLEGIQTLLSRFQDPRGDVDKLIHEAAEFIWRQFSIDNVAIGLRDPKDGLYKYKAMVGFRGDAIEAHKAIAYSKEQFFENGHYHGVQISKYSKIYLAEDNVITDAERTAFNRPVLLTLKRKDMTTSLEGDYIDIGIFGRGDDLVGWIEISGTRTMKLPDATTIRWVEVVASIIAAALMCTEGH